MTALVYVQGENGQLCGIWPEGEVPEPIWHRIGTGDLARVTKGGQPWDEDDEPDDAPPDAPGLPKRADSRQVWQEFAVSQGMDPDKAAAATKAELIEEFTKDDASS